MKISAIFIKYNITKGGKPEASLRKVECELSVRRWIRFWKMESVKTVTVECGLQTIEFWLTWAEKEFTKRISDSS